jgi:hypothetical protein
MDFSDSTNAPPKTILLSCLTGQAHSLVIHMTMVNEKISDQSAKAVYRRMLKGWEYTKQRHFSHKHAHCKKKKKAMMKESPCAG